MLINKINISMNIWKKITKTKSLIKKMIKK